MAIKPICDNKNCKEELKVFGGILLGPPNKRGYVKKLHLCVKCYNTILNKLNK